MMIYKIKNYKFNIFNKKLQIVDNMIRIKNLRKALIFSSILVILLLAVGSVSASENITDDSSLDQSDSDSLSDVDVDENADEPNSGDNFESDVYSDSDNDSNDSADTTNASSANTTQKKTLITYDEAYEKTTLEYSSVVTEYTSGNMIYKVKAYAVYNFNGIKYKDPKYNTPIKLRVYTGNKINSYTGYVGNDGIATIKVPNLSLGYHEVEIFVDNVKRATSFIKVVKSATKVYAPAKTIKFRKNTNYKIKVLDSHGNYVKNVALKVKVYTGSKSKTYTVYTNAKGVAKLKTSKLATGTHKIIIKTNNKKYNVNKTSKIVIKRNVPKTAAKLKVSAPAKTVKKGTSYTIKVTDSYDDAVKKVSLKVDVYTGKKVKTYKIKTNKNGIATLKTDKISLGTHNIKIKSNDKNYKLSKSSKVTVAKTVVSDAIQTTVLKNITYYPTANGKTQAKLGWSSKAGSEYQVLRKTTGSYGLLSTVKANSAFTTYYDDVDNGTTYTYSVREIMVKNSDKVLGPFDKEGLKLLKSPKVTADFTNMKASIKWNKVEGATKYIIFRKVGRDGTFKSIASVKSSELSYTDFYYKSADKFGTELINSKTFIDPSFNNLFYTVRAAAVKTVYDVTKTSYGLYPIDGDFHLEAPSIVSLNATTKKITWGKVPNADGYLILKRNSTEGEWEVIGESAQYPTYTTISKTLSSSIENTSYYTVKAFAFKNGEKVYSKFDEGFTLCNYSQNNSQYRILYFGDSITYGSPYKSTSSRHKFSIPWRVAELLGCVYYNPSIPGSTYHDLGQKNGKNIENTKYYRYRICREVVDSISEGKLPGNWKNNDKEGLDNAKNSEGITNTRIEDYNIVVLAAGTNDYLDNTPLGSLSSNDVKTFNGALNHIMNKIETASKNRVANNQTPIKVIFVDLYYSDRTYDYKVLNNRDVTPNQIGKTLMDYQKQLNKQYDKWSSSEYLTLYNFNTRDYNIVNQQNCPYTASDNLHFTKFTYGQYGNAFADFLVESVFTD